MVVASATESYQILRFADRISIFRVDNANITGNKQLLFFEEATSNTSDRDLRPSYVNTMEEALLNEGINRGSDNVFANDAGTNENNIERIDFIFDDGVTVPPDPAEEGFIILERGGNDDFKVAAIKSLGSSGDPDTFGTVLDIDRTTDWGASQYNIDTRVLFSDTPSDDLVETARTTDQFINGVFVSYDDLGFSAGDVFFGYSLAGGDASSTSTDWPTAANFPTNTSADSDGAGGLDLIAGGSVSSSNLVEGSYTLTGDACWRMLSSPVPTTYANLLKGLWTQGTSGADFTGGVSNVLIWPTAQSGNDPANWVAPASLNNAVPAGTGVLVSVYSDDDFDGTDEGFPKTVNVSGTGYEGGISPGLNGNTEGWTLVGNPYNFPIDFGSGSLTKTNINDVAYIYDRNLTGTNEGVSTNGNTGGWRTTSGGVVGDVFNGIIEPFQGFFIQNDNSGISPVFTFAEGAEDTSGDGDFYGKENEVPENVMRFEVSGEGLYNSAWITISENGSNERTTSDALELLPFSENYLLLGTRKEDTMFDIAHFPYMEDGEITLETETTQLGNYTISATDLDVNPDMELFFIDTEENIRIQVDENFSYSFEITETVRKVQKFTDNGLACGDIEQVREQFIPTPAKVNKNKPGRFILKVTGGEDPENEVLPDSFRLQQNYPNPFNPTTQITYELPQNSDVRLEVFDMNGRQVATLVNESVSAGTHTVNFNASDLSSGVYMYRLQAGNTVLTRKLTLIK